MKNDIEKVIGILLVISLMVLIIYATAAKINEIRAEENNWLTYKDTYSCRPIAVQSRIVTYLCSNGVEVTRYGESLETIN